MIPAPNRPGVRGTPKASVVDYGTPELIAHIAPPPRPLAPTATRWLACLRLERLASRGDRPARHVTSHSALAKARTTQNPPKHSLASARGRGASHKRVVR